MLDHVIYGSVTVNAKGQIVLPAETRKKMNIKPWDQLIVTSRDDLLIGLIKAENIWEFIDKIKKHTDQFDCIDKEAIENIHAWLKILSEYKKENKD